jgi:hypothetical protein
MQKLSAALACLLLIPGSASPQAGDQQFRAQGYIFIGEGSFRSEDGGLHGITHVGGGGEVRLVKGFDVGGELGAMGWVGEGGGVLSIDSSYHFLRSRGTSRVVPFLAGGYTRTIAGDYPLGRRSNLINFGGGINYWALKRVGLRLEFRDHFHHASPFFGAANTDHFWGLRLGLAFR